jgi:C4-type Zn-finger protein
VNQPVTTVHECPACGNDDLSVSAEEYVPQSSILVMIACRSCGHETFQIIVLERRSEFRSNTG